MMEKPPKNSWSDCSKVPLRAKNPASGLDSIERTASTNPPALASDATRSEEHTSELQSPCNLVGRLLLEKKRLLPGWPPRRRYCGCSDRAAHGRHSCSCALSEAGFDISPPFSALGIALHRPPTLSAHARR